MDYQGICGCKWITELRTVTSVIVQSLSPNLELVGFGGELDDPLLGYIDNVADSAIENSFSLVLVVSYNHFHTTENG